MVTVDRQHLISKKQNNKASAEGVRLQKEAMLLRELFKFTNPSLNVFRPFGLISRACQGLRVDFEHAQFVTIITTLARLVLLDCTCSDALLTLTQHDDEELTWQHLYHELNVTNENGCKLDYELLLDLNSINYQIKQQC